MARTRRFPTTFGERNRVVIAVVGSLTLVLLFLLTFNASALPVIGNGREYTAELAEAGGLKVGNEVRVAGVRVGEVTEVALDEDVVVVTFRAKGVELGDQSRAAVRIKTLLGQKYLAVESAGRGELDEAIPLERTTTPFDVTQAFSELSTTVEEIDTQQLEASFTALADAFRDTPDSLRATVGGLASLSRTISSRDEELAALLEASSDVTGTLASRNAEFTRILDDGELLLTELSARRETVGAMLEATQLLGEQLEGLVADNEATLAPALAELDEVAAILNRNQANLDAALSRLGPYYRVLASATGNGRWVDAYVCGLYTADGRPHLDNDVERTCTPAAGGGS
ncbi:MCE family protein [Nocardioides sp. CPCC 205120]|uniref:MCE family protein n=1 Tax=Nocardioides sp. CPCC 205120 TaxID=3406462 RepID=UPI003B5152AA